MPKHTNANNFNIQMLSEATPLNSADDCAVVMVGSFAPVHEGHFDAVEAAYGAISERKRVGALVLVPNSEEYVNSKFNGVNYGWTYEKRIDAITMHGSRLPVPAYVDNISGISAKAEQINNHVPITLRQRLGLAAHQLYFVVGSDQLTSMKDHLADGSNNAVCVLRPGSLDGFSLELEQDWAQQALASERLIVTERANMVDDISSTAIRKLSMAADNLLADGV